MRSLVRPGLVCDTAWHGLTRLGRLCYQSHGWSVYPHKFVTRRDGDSILIYILYAYDSNFSTFYSFLYYVFCSPLFLPVLVGIPYQ